MVCMCVTKSPTALCEGDDGTFDKFVATSERSSSRRPTQQQHHRANTICVHECANAFYDAARRRLLPPSCTGRKRHWKHVIRRGDRQTGRAAVVAAKGKSSTSAGRTCSSSSGVSYHGSPICHHHESPRKEGGSRAQVCG